ncbi:hypothetical protein SEEN2570_11447, partial [Salmonella enterica subsp. enterica serovar Newport str. VA_R100512570]
QHESLLRHKWEFLSNFAHNHIRKSLIHIYFDYTLLVQYQDAVYIYLVTGDSIIRIFR